MRLGLGQVFFIPAFSPPHKQADMPTAADRLEMVRLAVRGNPRFEALDIEIRRGGTSFTIDTIQELRQRYPGTELYFITGLDSFLEIRTWKDWDALLQLCAFVVLSRETCRFGELVKLEFLKVAEEELLALDDRRRDQLTIEDGDMRVILLRIPYYEVSSTDIRSRRKEGRSIKYLLPQSVEDYIIEKKFYAELNGNRSDCRGSG